MINSIKHQLAWLKAMRGANKPLDLTKLHVSDVPDDEVAEAIQSVPTHYGMNKISLHDHVFHNRLTSFIWDDFHYFTTTHLWTSLAADTTATVAAGDTANGNVLLSTDATDNNEAALFSTKKTFLFANNKPLMCEGRINFAEAATNAANVAFGFSSVHAANLLLDDGGGPAATMSGALIYKVDGSTVWKCLSQLGTTQTISTSTATAGGTADQTLRIEVMFVSSTIAEVAFFVDGAPLIDSIQTTRVVPIKHQLTYTSAVAMGIGAYVKAGTGANQPLSVDYMLGAQTRT